MVFVVLCGAGAAVSPASSSAFPRPLTPILGSPALRYSLQALAGAVPELVFVYGAHLSGFHFEEVVANLFPRTRCTFTRIDFATRGALETALVGVQQLRLPPHTPLVFLNSDNVYSEALAELAAPSQPTLGFDDAPLAGGVGAQLCSLRLSPCGGAVEALSETERVPGTAAGVPYGTGVYGFPTAALFLTWAAYTLRHGPFPSNELYLSSVFTNMLRAGGLRVAAHRCPILAPLSSPAAVLRFIGTAPRRLRLCFALDGTLVTPPATPGDLSSVRPVAASIALARWARSEGHTVIIHTARTLQAGGMAAGRATLDTLEALDIPFDELIFGRPEADVYIDARGLNPLLQPPLALGLPPLLPEGAGAAAGAHFNALPNNKYKTLRVEGGRLVKQGPAASLRGEINFYETLASAAPALHKRCFAAYFGSRQAAPAQPSELGDGGTAASSDEELVLGQGGSRMEFTMELVRGVPLTTLLRAGLLQPYHLRALMAVVAELHSWGAGGGDSGGAAAPAAAPAAVPLELPLAELAASYRHKLAARFAHPAYAALPDAAETLARLTAATEAYLASGRLRVARIVHGDCWFANIILTPANELRLIDMRGLVGSRLTLNGDPVYDYAKLLQSVLGFDEIVFGLAPAPLAYRAGLAREFGALLRAQGAVLSDVLALCAGLVAGCLPFYESASVRAGLWRLARSVLGEPGGGGRGGSATFAGGAVAESDGQRNHTR